MSDVIQGKSPPDRFETSGKGGGYDLPAAIRLAETVHSDKAAAMLYRGITKELDANPLIGSELYWDSYGALQTLAVNWPGVEDSVEDPFPLNRHVRPKTKEPLNRIPSIQFHYHPKLVAIAVAVGLCLFVVKPALDYTSPCPTGSSVENTGFQNLCVSNRNGDTVKVLQTYNP